MVELHGCCQWAGHMPIGAPGEHPRPLPPFVSHYAAGVRGGFRVWRSAGGGRGRTGGSV